MSITEDEVNYRKKRSARIYASLYDDTLRKVGMRAPEPIIGQDPDDYRRETLRTMKKTFLANHELGKVNMRGLPSEALDVFEPQVLNAVPKAAFDPANNAPGESLRKVEVLDDYGKVREINFVGKESFVKEMGRHGRRVVSFRTDQGFVDASGRALR